MRDPNTKTHLLIDGSVFRTYRFFSGMTESCGLFGTERHLRTDNVSPCRRARLIGPNQSGDGIANEKKHSDDQMDFKEYVYTKACYGFDR